MKLHEALVQVIDEGLMPRLKTKIEDLLPKMPEKASGEQIAAMLRNNGVSDHEIKWTKIDKLLKQPKVTKDEIVSHLAAHGLPFTTKDQEGKRYQKWALQGGKNYGEKTFHMDPTERDITLDWELDSSEKEKGELESWETRTWPDHYSTVGVLDENDKIRVIGRTKNYDSQSNSLFKKVFVQVATDKSEVPALVAKAKQACQHYVNTAAAEQNVDGKDFRSSHFGDKTNPLFHVRHQEFKDADGKKLWLIEEIQSDWHQEGRKKGYRGDFKAEIKHVPGATNPYHVYMGDEKISGHTDEAGAKAGAAEIEPRWNRNNGVPNAPMKKSWEEMAFKWALHQAVEAGSDRIGWVTGQMSADRYDLSKQLDKVEVSKVDSEKWDTMNPSQRKVHVFASKDNEDVISKLVKLDNLDDIIGKELAKKIVKDLETGNSSITGGLDLKVGGAGMKAAYDQRIVSIARKIAKNTGAMTGKVGLVGSQVGDDNERDVPVYPEPAEVANMPTEERMFVSDEPDEAGKFYVNDYDGKNLSDGFDSEEAAHDERDNLFGQRKAAKQGRANHEVWYMEINSKVKDLVANGMRATFESEKPKTKNWWVV